MTHDRKYLFLQGFFAILGLFTTARAHASAPPLPDVRARWIDARGTPRDVPGKVSAEWVWDDDQAGPFVRLRIEVARSITPEALEFRKEKIAFDHGVATLSVKASTVSAKLSYLDEKKTAQEAGLLVELIPNEAATLVWLHPSCDEAGITAVASPKKQLTRALFVAVKCGASEKGGDRKWKLRLIPSDGAVLAGGNLEKSELTLDRPEKIPPEGVALGTFGVKDAKEPAGPVYELRAGAPLERRLGVSAGLGFSSVSYQESPGAIDVSQIGLTPKAGAVYRLTPKIDLGLSAFATLVAVTHAPASLDWARFFGVNARGGYRLPKRWLDSDWKASVGWYFWGMSVKEPAYGVAFLSGPQLFVSLDRPHVSRPWSAYVKYAPTAESIGALSLGNAELAAGAAVRVTSKAARHRVDATLDVSHTSFAAPSAGLTMNLFTVSLGAQYDLGALLYKQ